MVDPTGIIKGVAGPVLQVAGGEVSKRADYNINYKDNLQKFSDLYKELEARQKDVLKSVEEDEMKYNRVPTESVKKWQDDTEKFLSDIKTNHEVLLMDDDDRKRIGKSFLGFWNPKKLYDFSRMAQKKADQIDRLLRKANGLGFNKFTHSSGPPSLEMFRGKFCVGLESRLKILEKIMDVLNNDTKVNRIGVFGMGGAGKTTLVEEIACRAERENFFKKVIIAEISKSPNIKLIQDCIANRIGLDLNRIQSEKERALKLNESLKKMRRELEQKSNNSKQESSSSNRERKLLIILDNLWDKFEVQHLGISYELQMDLDCKIIVVSRKKDVCQKMDASDNYIYEVGDLSDSEAKLLFEEKVGQNTTKKEEYKLVMDDILKKCSRLPLSISIIADRLRNQSVDDWKLIVQQLDKSNSSNSISDILYSTHSVLEMSYNSIYSEEEKMFFLLCCIFHYGERILFWNLLDYGIGIGLFQNMISLVTATHKAREWVENLMSSSLLLAFDTDSGEIKIHDDVREAGILIAKKGKQSFHIGDCSSWMLEGTFKKHSIISMSSSNNCKYLSGLHLPRLQLLRICKSSFSNQYGFKRMHNIKVLDLSGSTIENFPSAEDTMQTLRVLLLDDCFSSINIPQLCKLVKLEVLSLKRSNIKELPEEIGNLRNLKLLYLTSSLELKNIPAGALAKLSHLEGLFMKDGFKDWEYEKDDNVKDCPSSTGMASISELKSLPLKVLEVDVRNIRHLPDDDIFADLSIFRIRIGERFKNMYMDYVSESVQTSSIHDILFSSRLYIVGGNKSDLERKKGLTALMKKAKTLWLENINGLTKIVSAIDGYRLSNLKALTIFGCTKMKCVVEENETTDSNKSSKQDQSGMYDIFPNLEDLTLYDLPELGSYVFPAQVARKLKVIRVVGCEKLKSIFAYMRIQKGEGSENNEIEFPSLQKLMIRSSNSLEDFCCEIGNASNTSQLLFGKKIKLPHLETLHLEGIDKIRHVWSDYEEIGKDNCDVTNLKISFPSLAELEIMRLDNIEMLWDKASLEELVRLKAIDFWEMPKLRHISSEVSDQNGLLKGLKSIRLTSCKAIESLISELPPNEDFVFSNLQKLTLSKQEYFKCIRHQSFRVNFKALHELELGNLYLDDVQGEQEKSSNQVGGEIEGQQMNERSMLNISLRCEKVEFPSLEKLKLFKSFITSDESYRASNSTEIRLEYLPLTMLQNLTSLILENLDMRCLFPTKSILLALQKLEELSLSFCKSLNDFFGGVDHEKDHQHGATERLQLSSLRILRLEGLPKLKQLPCQIFPGLQELHVWGCNKFHIPVYITKTGTTGGGVTLLSKLQKLIVIQCYNTEAIFGGKKETQAEDHGEESTNDVVQYALEFPSLESIEIYRMLFLRTIFDTSAAGGGGCSYDVQLPSLQSVNINECFNMESFSSGTPIAPKLTSIEINGQQIDAENCTAGDLNSAVQCQFNKRQKVVSDWPKKLKYREHQHELMLVTLPWNEKCNACNSYTYWEFGFSCIACRFSICGRCGLESILESHGKDQPEKIPNQIKMAMKWPKTLNLELHHHELNLQAVTKEVPTWCLESHWWLSVKPKKDYCRICQGEISDIFAYSCKNQSCNFSLHRKCALREEHQVTEKSSGIACGNRGPPDLVPAQPVELAIPELSPLPEFTDSRTPTVPTSPSETLATQEIVSNVPLATTDEFNAKITAAEQAFSLWQNTSIVAGQHITLKLLELITKDTDKIAFKITTEQEKFLKDTLGELYRGIEMVGQVSEMSTFQTEEIVLSRSREPLGSNCVEISTANLPSTVLLWMILVAITCGNTFVLKSSQISPEKTYIQWPASLVTFETKESFVGSKENVKGKRIEVDPKMIVKRPIEVYPLVDESMVDCLTNDTEELHFCLSKYLPENCSFLVKLPNSVFLFGEDRETWMLRDDFIHFFKYECLNISIMHVFLLYVMDKCGEYGFTHISCLCPEAISKSRMSIVSTREQCFTYLSNGVETCLKLDKRLIFLPYHEGYHWRLLVVCLPKNTVHVFDPANDKINKDIYIKRFLNVIFKNLLKVQLNWSFVECPKQHENTECGYYIMRYLEDIINKFAQTSDLEQDYKGPSTLTHKELDEIRDKWSRYFVDKYC